MSLKERLVASECITDGHPDKVCDQIADAMVDAALSVDSKSRVALEASIKDNTVFIFGEVTTEADMDYVAIVNGVLNDIGYGRDDYEVIVRVGKQSPQINAAVDSKDGVTAGDQGIMFGYATSENKHYLGYSQVISNELALRLRTARALDLGLHPDAKTQVSIRESFQNGDKVYNIDSVLVSACHEEHVELEDIKKFVLVELTDIVTELIETEDNFALGFAGEGLVYNRIYDLDISPVVVDLLDREALVINPSGRWTLGGPYGDSGTTGRKIVVDTYGGIGRVGGGAFSSKDPSKVDRSAAYYARFVAKNIVAAGLADECEVGLSYMIGIAEPMSVNIDTFGTNKTTDKIITRFVLENFAFDVPNIINSLDLLNVRYRDTTNFGHFYNRGLDYETHDIVDLCLPWEEVIEELSLGLKG